MTRPLAWIRPRALVLAVIGLAAGAGSAADGATLAPHGAARAAATLALKGSLSISSVSASRRFGNDCAPGSPTTVECFDVRGNGIVPGLGRVSLTSLQFVETAPQGCPPGGFEVIGAPMRLSVAGKGVIELRLDPAPGCRTLSTVLSHTRSYTVVGATGVYAGATGAGTVRREAGFQGSGARGTDLVTGTLVVPGLAFDLSPPRLSGASPKTVRAAKGASRARVSYQVTARDAVDKRVAVKCTPPSGSQFRVGRTLVRCSATDSSGNTARATFAVVVRKAG